MSRIPGGRLRAESGYTVVELSVALALASMIFAAMVTVLYSFSQQAGDAGRRAELQSTTRELIARMVVELRQAEKVTPNGYPVESLDADHIVFYTDRLPTEGPERVVYQRTNCADGICELWVTRYTAVAGTGPWWTFSTTPVISTAVLQRVAHDLPLFAGIVWVGDPVTKLYVDSCGLDGPACAFPLVDITLRARPIKTSAGADTVFQVEEEVRLRNE
jgi:type II secretory pathway pseudopilin PulG